MKKIVSAISVLLLVAFANTSFGAVSVLMKLVNSSGTQIMGESITKGYEGWVELSAFGEGSQNPLSTGANPGPGRININDINIQGYLSAVSLPLQSIMYTGAHLKSVDIVFLNTSVDCTCPYYKIHLESVFITSMSGSTSDEREQQQISFAPLFLAWAYYKQDARTGVISTTPTNTFYWDKAANKLWTDFRF